MMNINESIQPPQAIMTSTVTDHDVRQIESFFLSLKTRVFVCPGLANLYFATLQDMANLGGWELATTGFPTLVMELNPNNVNNTQEYILHLCLAEKGTGFVLWKDVVNTESNYKAPGKNFHTMTTSKDRKKLAGFSFDDASSARQLQSTVEAWIKEVTPVDTGKKKKKKDKNGSKSKKGVKKETISQPCCFEHITQLDHESFMQRASGNSVTNSMTAPPETPPPPPPNGSQTINANISSIPPAPIVAPPCVPNVPPSTDVESVTKATMAYAESTSTEDSGLDEPAALPAESEVN
ncbi:uncharacterized protein [Amphiura filiformis]|uniref:uncharacterized protein n=1 Tax=Amphiura filiformis TaxID=82378 RepID=UPI003B221BD1